ncbi:NUDIX domain-containing protein [Streptacidiphilus sp. PB12-B1b]|uniref:NUDIX hydrolase n=1 Tax=Streptacidiphilus sp. PB12-B1b TaxID=2705012 RepID=UPI0015FC7755|nr:NUDIX domain-containing protein [Streptacidiphilus sp. PB12-B1b]QMU77568.1 NUDIX domain-containing protein [Streptacidiphilus sp. PB12-B1b]
MIVWVNGTCGVGKTSTVGELRALLPGSTVFDPDAVGAALRGLLPPEVYAAAGDVQDLSAWRQLVPATAVALLSELPGPLIVPMTLLRQDYRDEIFGAFAASREPVHHVLLHAEETILRKRIEADPAEPPQTRQRRLDGIAAYQLARDWLQRDAVTVDTSELTPRQAAEQIAGIVQSGTARCPIVEHSVHTGDTVAAAVLLFDEQDRVLLVDPVYKAGWEFPGGVVEDGEQPTLAAVREIDEELGLTLDPARLRLLVADWEPHRGPRTGGLRLVFDGGRLGPAEQAGLALQADELRAWRFTGPAEWPELLPDNKHRRLAAALGARDAGQPRYLEAGVRTDVR